MSEIALREEPRGSLVAWAEEAREAHQIAVSLARTSFVPKAMQGRPEEVTGAILAGRELGLSPMSALRSIDVIDGTPAMRANAMRGLVQAHGHELWVEESSDNRAIVCGRRRDSSNTERVVWTIDRAKKAGLAGKKNWQNHPAAMLVARATAEVCRRVAADVLLGMPYAVEEVSDDQAAEQLATVAAPKAKPRTLKRAALPPAAPEEPAAAASPLAEAVEAVEAAEASDEPEPMTERQKRALMAAYGKAKLGDRAERLAHAERRLGREIGSFNDLTRDEAARLLDAFDDVEEVPISAEEAWPVEEHGTEGQP